MKKLWIVLAVVLLSWPSSASAQQTPWLVLKTQSWRFDSGPTVTIVLASGTKITIPASDIDGERTTSLDGTGPPHLDKTEVRTKCAKDWPNDFAVRAFCEKQQTEAASRLQARAMSSADEQTIRKKCLADWPDDFTVRDFCEVQQLKALRIVK